MEYLRRIGREALGDFDRILGHPCVNGLLIETDPTLRRLWQIRATMTRADWEAFDVWLAESGLLFSRYWDRGLPGNAALDTWITDGPSHQRPLPCDPDWTCRAFREFRQRSPVHARALEGPSVIFTVLYDPSMSRGAFEELSAMATDMRWAIQFAARPVAHAQAGPRAAHSPVIGGISMGEEGRQERGTLGGILVLDEANYAVTCGHIIPAAARAVQPCAPDGGSSVIGTCLFSTEGDLVGAGQVCRGSGAVNSIDAALVRVDVAATQAVHKIGDVVRALPRKDVAEGEILHLSARSGTRSLEVGGLALRRSVKIRGTGYCFEDLIELRRPGRLWGLKGSIKPPTKGGDSGAWLIRSTAGTHEWVGMVTANDGPSSYAQFAETVETWARNAISSASPI